MTLNACMVLPNSKGSRGKQNITNSEEQTAKKNTFLSQGVDKHSAATSLKFAVGGKFSNG